MLYVIIIYVLGFFLGPKIVIWFERKDVEDCIFVTNQLALIVAILWPIFLFTELVYLLMDKYLSKIKIDKLYNWWNK